MIKTEFFFDGDDITGFNMKGHAGFAEYGSDIVCAAVSMLVLNTINSIEEFTDVVPVYHEEESKGVMNFRIDRVEEKSQLLLKSLFFGLESVRKEYGKKYIDIKKSKNHKEV